MDSESLEICSGDPVPGDVECQHRRDDAGYPGCCTVALVPELPRRLVYRFVWHHSAFRDRSLCLCQDEVPIPEPHSDRVTYSTNVSADIDPDGILPNPDLRRGA